MGGDVLEDSKRLMVESSKCQTKNNFLHGFWTIYGSLGVI
jgi:hypothetical protein